MRTFIFFNRFFLFWAMRGMWAEWDIRAFLWDIMVLFRVDFVRFTKRALYWAVFFGNYVRGCNKKLWDALLKI